MQSVKMKKQVKKIDTEEDEEEKHWDAIVANLGMIEETETWLDAGWLETSSLEEQRYILYGSTDTDNDTTNKTYDVRQESMENMEGKTGKKVYMLAGLFQRDGKGKSEILSGRTDATALLSRNDVERAHKDAEEGSIWNNFEEDIKSSRVDKHDRVEEPTDSEDFILLRQEDNGPSPAVRENERMISSTSSSSTVKFGRQQSRRSTVTHAFTIMKDIRSSNIPLRSTSEMHEPRLATLTAITKSEMRCQERSPGGGKISKTKIKSETPRKSKVKAMKKLFEQEQVTGGTIELLFKANFNPNLGAKHSGTKQKDSICASQPGRGIQTGPRQPCRDGFRPDADWLSQPGLGESSQSTGM